MAEEVKVEGNAESVATSTRQRKKRKWDQPAESVIAASASTAGLMPLNSTAALAGISLPGIFPSLVGVYPSMPTSTASAQISSAFSTVQQSAAAIIQKINQDLAAKGVVPPNKIQDEVIAREIVINDAEPGVRYKLTKRQTQEEIQAKTGAVVITRGKYKPPNGPADHEKPLYLHISAGAHLKDTAERVKAVDQAAALVDDMLKQGRQVLGPSSIGQIGTNSPLSAVVFVDFEADSSLDLISRIRGPNDQYINHIMHETGATVLMKGGACESSCSDEIPQPLHLLISAEHAKSLDDARSLAEHLLETIRSEVAGTRPPYFPPPVSYNLQQSPQIASHLEPGNSSLPQSAAISAAVQSVSSNPIGLPSLDFNARLGALTNYSAVPPPQQLIGADAGPGKAETGQSFETSSVSMSVAGSPLATFAGSLPTPYASGALNQTFAQQTYGIYPQASRGSEPYPSYSAYSGLYPQASPLQQVALALQRPVFSQSSVQPSPSLPPESMKNPMSMSAQRQAERQERQRRKFQEGPALKRDPLADQAFAAKQSKQVGSLETAASKLMPPSRTASAPPYGTMPPPPPVNMPPPSMPPSLPRAKLNPVLPLVDTKPVPNQPAVSESAYASRSMSPAAPPVSMMLPQPETTGIKLVEYGEDEDDDNDDTNGRIEPTASEGTVIKPYANGKPFWAV